jgi:predicted metal-dependent hydrolase
MSSGRSDTKVHEAQMAREPEKERNLDQQIDENLRRIYRERLEEAVPDRFEELLRRLRQQDGKK